jgi:hypothetical protein
MTTTYLGFLMNRQSREEFVAPVIAETLVVAKIELAKAYPESRYMLQTIYSRLEIDHVLAGIDRWPGLPSKVQPPVTTDLSKVTAQTGGLPPLPGQATAATVQKVDNNTQALPAWMQSFVASQQVAPAQPQAAMSSPAPQVTMQSAINQMMAEQRPQQAPQSLIERLKMAKGETFSAKAPALPAAAVQEQAKAGSVIDILKGMRK